VKDGGENYSVRLNRDNSSPGARHGSHVAGDVTFLLITVIIMIITVESLHAGDIFHCRGD